MSRKLILSNTIIILALAVMAGCQLGGGNTVIPDKVQDDALVLQQLIPALEAGMQLPIAGNDGLSSQSQGYSVMTVDGSSTNGKDPATVYSEGSGDPVRYPATGYIEDLYGVDGNKAYFTVALEDDKDPDPDIYRVNLYIYPTLYTSVDYIHEEYLVNGTSWTIVDSSGADAPLAYITNETVYFDGRVQAHNVVDNSVATGALQYAQIPVADDPLDASYSYPGDPLSQDPPTGPDGTAVYSAKVESTVSSPESATDLSGTIVEYYTETTENESSAVSYIEQSTGGWLAEKTVRRYHENRDSGTKTVRSRTTSTLTIFGQTTSNTITEKTDISKNASGETVFSSVVSREGDSTPSTTTIELEETGTGTNVYEGTVTIDSSGQWNGSYEAVLDSTSGLILYDDGQEIGSFDASRRTTDRIIELILPNLKGKFRGWFEGGVLSGTYTHNPDVQYTMQGNSGGMKVSRGNAGAAF